MGQDLDPEAAREVRRDRGIPVHIGPLETAPYANASFDAVIMSHVIEHVHDPIGLLRACKSFLKPSGVLIALTPNTAGCIHRRFGADWRGLDPPPLPSPLVQQRNTATHCRASRFPKGRHLDHTSEGELRCA